MNHEPTRSGVYHDGGKTASKILPLIRENGTITKERLAQMTGYSGGAINAQLSVLKRARLVRYVGKTENPDQSSDPTPTVADTAVKLKMRLITWDEFRQYVERKNFSRLRVLK